MLLSIEDNISVLIDKSNEPTILSVQEPNLLTSYEEPTYLNTTKETTAILYTGITGPAGPVAGITENTETLPFVGSGTGLNRTTTKTEGDLIFESFAVNGELYVNWIVAEDVDRSKAQTFHGHIFSETSQVGTFASWEIGITSEDIDGTKTSGTLFATDLPLPDTAFTGEHALVTLPAGVYVTPNTLALHFRIKRIASSNDPSNGVGVINVHMIYWSDGRVGEAGPAGVPGGEDEVAQEKRVDFNEAQDIIYKGEAVPGTPDAASIWRIRKITIASDNDVRETWADGSADYIKVWDDRLTYTYS